MMKEMFCFQCEQTANGTGCQGKAGVCGKQSSTANVQDDLTGALIALARAAQGKTVSANANRLMLEGLFSTITNVNFNDKMLKELIEDIEKEKDLLGQQGGGSCTGKVACKDYDMALLWQDDEDIRSLKSLILFGLRGMAAYAYHAMVLGYTDDEVSQFFFEGMHAIGEDWDMEKLLPLVLKRER